MRRAWEFGKLFLFSPSKAADACLKKDAFRNALVLNAFLLALSLFFSWVNPLKFLDPNAPVTAAHSAGFWLRVLVWEPVLLGLSTLITVVIIDWLRDGWLPFKAMTSMLWSLIPGILALFYLLPTTTLNHKFFILALVVWAFPLAPLSRRIARKDWLGIGIFLLGMSVIQGVGEIASLATMPLRSIHAFYTIQGGMLLWFLICAGTGLSRIARMSTARSVLAVFFGMFVGITLPAVAYVFDMMPKEVLKVFLFG